MFGTARYTIELDDDRWIVVVKYSGMIDLRDRRQAVEAASKAIREKGFRKILVDFSNARMEIHAPEEESEFADLLSSHDVLMDCRTAYFSRPGQSINWFIEVLAQARHFPCRHFTDRELAYQWLAGIDED